MVHAALLLLMLEAVTKDLVFTISLKRSTQNLQLSTSWAGRLPHLSATSEHLGEEAYLSFCLYIGRFGSIRRAGQLADLFLEISGRLNKCRSNSGIGRSL